MPKGDLRKDSISNNLINMQFSRIVNAVNTSYTAENYIDMKDNTQFIIDRIKSAYLILLDEKIKNKTLLNKSSDISNALKFDPNKTIAITHNIDNLKTLRQKSQTPEKK